MDTCCVSYNQVYAQSGTGFNIPFAHIYTRIDGVRQPLPVMVSFSLCCYGENDNFAYQKHYTVL
jgi:hypothetical protein